MEIQPGLISQRSSFAKRRFNLSGAHHISQLHIQTVISSYIGQRKQSMQRPLVIGIPIKGNLGFSENKGPSCFGYAAFQGFNQPMFDNFVIAIAKEVILRRQPELLYVHICQIDNAKHYAGLGSEKVCRAIENTDRLLGELISALTQANILEETNIILCADHGQQPVTHISYPNRILASHGLLQGDNSGNILQWRAQVQSACLSAFLYAESEEAAKIALNILSCPENMDELGISKIISRKETKEKYHLDGDFAAVLLGKPGVYFHNAMDTGAALLTSEQAGIAYKANHGHDPHTGEKPFFLISGPDAAAGVHIQNMKLIDEALTVAALMVFEMPWADGIARTELIKPL